MWLLCYLGNCWENCTAHQQLIEISEQANQPCLTLQALVVTAQLAQPRISSNIQKITQCCELSFKLTLLFCFQFFMGTSVEIQEMDNQCSSKKRF